jgi:trans-aconitate 2-methyltransferase
MSLRPRDDAGAAAPAGAIGKRRLSYALGHSEIAATRLEMVARVFEPATRLFLREVGGASRNLGVDLGCGPGHTTALLAEVLRCRRTVGLDFSAEFVARARRFASDRIAFCVHDVTAVPFPVGPADLVYCRLLLTHLRDPARVIARWATQLFPGGLLMMEEVESIATSSPALERYLGILDQMLRSQSNQLYIGSELERAVVPPSLAKRKSGVLEFPVSPVDAAAMFALNLRTWRDHPFVRAHVEEAEVQRLERELDALQTHVPKGVEIVWKLRHLIYERT